MQHAQSVTFKPGGNATTEDAHRVHFYRLLAHYLSAPPSLASLGIAAGLSAQPGTPLGDTVNLLADAARQTSVTAEADAYQALFIGLGRGIFVPYGSYYLTGFLHEKPLARLRSDMSALGIARNEEVSEPEDHISAVLEMMAGLIAGDFGSASAEVQKRFFEAHVGSWAAHFFRDLSLDQTSAFYAALGALGLRFLDIEESAFSLV